MRFFIGSCLSAASRYIFILFRVDFLAFRFVFCLIRLSVISLYLVVLRGISESLVNVLVLKLVVYLRLVLEIIRMFGVHLGCIGSVWQFSVSSQGNKYLVWEFVLSDRSNSTLSRQFKSALWNFGIASHRVVIEWWRGLHLD